MNPRIKKHIRKWCEEVQPIFAFKNWTWKENDVRYVPSVDQLCHLAEELYEEGKGAILVSTGRIAVRRRNGYPDLFLEVRV